MSTSDSYDFIVIGGGSAGYAAAALASKLGLQVAVIEGAREIGGLCILRGCMPSKTLLESALRAETIRNAGEFGLRAEYFGPTPGAIRARKRKLIGEFADYRRGQLEDGRFAFIRGHAQFVDAHTLDVALFEGGQRRITAKSFLIATGSEISVPPVPGLEEAGYQTSDDVLDASEYPDSVLVLGGGAIALELASFFSGIGVTTSVLQRSAQVLKEMDADVATDLVTGLRHRGIDVHLNTKLERIEKAGALKRAVFTDADGCEQTLEAAEIICALGRHPNTAKLGLAAAGVSTKKDTVLVNPAQATNIPHIFAAGDVCGPHEVVHLAVQQGEIAARNAARLLGKLPGPAEEMDYRLKLFAVFTHPQVAAVGLNEREAKEQGLDFLVAKYPFADHGKSIVKGEIDGFVKLLADRKTRQIIGGSCVGPEASELIHEIVVAMRFEATAGQLAGTPHYHPTLSEIWTYPAEELA